MEEIFKDIEHYEGLYQISNFGRVYNVKRGKFLKPIKINTSYLLVGLSKDGKVKKYLLHRLVATAFLENKLQLPQVNHINEVKTDNRLENLEWCDNKYNNTYGTKIQRMLQNSNFKATREKSGKPKKVVLQFTRQGEFVAEYSSIKEAEKQTGISNAHISECCNNKRNHAGNYLWRYKEEYEKVKMLKIPNWEELRKKGGKATAAKYSKKVLQFTRQGEFIAEYPSAHEASRQTDIRQGHISQCCNNKRKSIKGYIFKFKEEVE